MNPFLDYAARNSFALFPCAAGTKRPILKWKDGSTADPAIWAAWTAEGHNLAIDCAKSGLIILDVDASKVSREQAWQAYHSLCVSWGLPAALAPSTQSARGGWHIPFRRPADFSPADLRGGGTLIKISDIRTLDVGEQDGEVVGFKNRGYCVAPGSTLDTPAGPLPYLLLSDAPMPSDAPAGLIEAIRLPVIEVQANGATGLSEPTDVANLVAELDALGEFSVEPDWFKYLGAIKLALGDTERGLEVARQMTRDDATEEALLSRWTRLASIDDGRRKCRIGTMIHRYKELTGKAFRVGKSVAGMFAGVPMLASPSIVPSSGCVPLTNTAAVVADLGRSTVESFIAAKSGRPALDAPKIPDSAAAHPLFDLLNKAIALLIGDAEAAPKTFRASGALGMLGVLSLSHESTFTTVCARVRAAGAALPESKLNAAARRFEAQISREVRTGTGWATDAKGLPDGSNTDNVAVFARIIGADFRFNDWSKRVEISSDDADWTPMEDRHFDKLLTTAGNGQHNFRPREGMFERAIRSLAYESSFDPVLDRIATAESMWDGRPRLNTWLATAIGAPNDDYLASVGRNVLGGMVKRARKPGSKHDEVMILLGPEDTLKSTLCRVLAMQDDWFSDSIDFSGKPQDVIPQLFGRTIIELSELDGMARQEVQYIKRFLSAQSDNITLKYEKFTSDHARRCLFIGTSNETNPLRGDGGNRRFLPVRVERLIDIEFVRSNLDQIVGEAARLEAAGELFLIPRDVVPEARRRQEAARSEADFEIHLNSWFADKPGATYILPADLATLLKDAVGRSVPSNQYGAAMRKLGFVQMTPRVNGGPSTRVWCRGGMDGAQRYTMHRSVSDGRLSPRLPMFAAIAPPPPPDGSAVVLPMVRPQ